MFLLVFVFFSASPFSLRGDEEVLAGMEKTPRAERLESYGFWVVFIFGVLALAALLLLALQRIAFEVIYRVSPTLYDWLPASLYLDRILQWLGSAFVVVLVAFSLGVWSGGQKRRACKAEWARRYPFGIEVKQAEEAIANGEAEWIAILSARFLPYGGSLWLRVDLKQDDTPFGPLRCRRFADNQTIYADLLLSEQRDLRVIMQNLEQALSRGEDVLGQPHFVFDGLPCDLTLLRKGTAAMRTFSLNMSGDIQEETMAHVPRLCARLLAIGRSVGGP